MSAAPLPDTAHKAKRLVAASERATAHGLPVATRSHVEQFLGRQDGYRFTKPGWRPLGLIGGEQ
jgi:hypothetical protein